MKSIVVFFTFLMCCAGAYAQMPDRTSIDVSYSDRHTGEAVAGTDVGRFQDGEPNVIIVPDGTDDSIVCRYRSAAGNCYRLSIDDGRGHVPVVLVDRASFDNWGEAFRSRPGWGICEIIEDPWSAWAPVGALPTEPGEQSYLETRTCSTGGNAAACADTCPTGSETRTVTVYNEPPACTDTSWSPPPAEIMEGFEFEQTSNCGNTRNTVGTMYIDWDAINDALAGLDGGGGGGGGGGPTPPPADPTPPPADPTPPPTACVDTSWSPPIPGSPSDYYVDEYLDQVSNCGNTQRVYGTKERVTVVVNPPDPPPPCTVVPAVYSAAIAYGYAYESDAAYITSSDPNDFNNQVNSTLNYISQMGMTVHSYSTDTQPEMCI